MAYNPAQTRLWTRATPNDGLLLEAEYNRIYGNTAALKTEVDKAVSSGLIQMYAGAAAPGGWLLCNGAEVSRSTYAALFAVCGTTYNIGGEAGTDFRLPDFRGIFPKGAGTTDRDPDGKDAAGNFYESALGAYSQDKMQGHEHDENVGTDATNADSSAVGISYRAGRNIAGEAIGRVATTQVNTNSIGSPIADPSNGTPRTGTLTEPQNLGISFIIKI